MFGRPLLLVVCVVLAGCAAPVAAPDRSAAGSGPGPADAAEWPADPPTDGLGWEAGVWYNESVDVDQSDGLSDAELDRYVARTMARVERLRNLEFRESVPVEVVSRAAYRNRSGGGPSESAWNDQAWEALFLVGEDRNASSVLREAYSGSILGYYSPAEDRIVVVSETSTPTIARTTLAHELLHALQDQHFGLGSDARTFDAKAAHRAVVEGDARYLDMRYEERCGDEWSCVSRPDGGGDGGGPAHPQVYARIYFPYSDGPAFVHERRQAGGWDAVNRLYERPPASTEQVIHPDAYPTERPVPVHVPDRSGAQWRRFDRPHAADTVGEASLFVALWAAGAVPRSHLTRDDDRYSAYDYGHPATAGWAGDAIVPYRKPAGPNATRYGYVARSRWDTAADAGEFAAAYRDALDSLGAESLGGGVYRIPHGPFADAFRVERRGSTVTVVNAPTVDALDDVHAGG